MVKVSREGKSKSGFLAGIEPIKPPVAGQTWLIYGRSGTGKTTVLSTFKKPLLLVRGQDGTRSIFTAKGIDVTPVMTDPTNLDDVIGILSKKGQQYKTVGLDCVDDFQALMLREIIGRDVPIQLAFGEISRDQYQECALRMKDILNTFIKLSEHGINVVLLSQEKTDSEEGSSTGLLMPTVASNVSPAVSKWLNAAVDYIGQTFIRRQKITVKSKGTSKTQEEDQWCLRIGPHPVYTTKFRAPPGIKIPQLIVNPNYTKLENLVLGKEQDVDVKLRDKVKPKKE